MRSKNLVPVQVILPQSPMGNNHSAQRGAFEEALQSSIEASLRTSRTAPSHVFSVLYHRSRPLVDDGRPGPSTSHLQSSLLPPDNGDEEIDVKPDISGLNIARQSSALLGNFNDQRTQSSPTTTTVSPREQQQDGTTGVLLPAARMPPPLLMSIRPGIAQTANSDHNNNGNRFMLPRLPSMIPKNIHIEQLKHAQEQVKHLQQIQRWQMLQQRHHHARAVINSLSIPRLPLINPLMPAMNRNALVTPGSSINGINSQDPANTINQNSPGSPMFRKGYCKGGKDIRLSTLSRDGTQIAPFQSEYVLVAMSISPSVPQVAKSPGSYHPPDIPAEAMVVVAISVKCLPPQQHELRPLLARCIGCGETALHTFATLSSHINLRTASPSHTNVTLSGINPLQRHARNFVHRDSNMPHGCIRGAVVPWCVSDVSSRLPSVSLMSMYQQPLLGMSRPRTSAGPMQQPVKYKPGQARFNLLPAQQLRPQLLTPAGLTISHRDINKTQPTSRVSPIVLDSPASASQSDRSSTSDALAQSRLDPDWNSTVKLPENLPGYVGRPLVLVCWEWQQLQSNIRNVHITHSYTKCFEEAMGDCHNAAVTPLSREICYMVTAQYLTSLDKHEFPTATALSAWLGRSRLMLASMPQVQLLSQHVVSLARMTISNNMHKIGLVISQISQAHAINECIANLRPNGPSMHLVAHINGDTILDLSILLTGHTSRLTREHLLTSEEYHDIIEKISTSDQSTNQLSVSLLIDNISKFSSTFSRADHRMRISFLLPQKQRYCNVSTSSSILSAPSLRKLASNDSNDFSTSNTLSKPHFDENNNDSRIPTEKKDKSANDIADQLFSKVSSLCEDHTKLDLTYYSSVQCCFILPESPVCKYETISDITISGVLQDLGIASAPVPSPLDLRKIMFTVSPKTRQRFNALCQHVKSNSSILFIMFVVDAHLHCDTNSMGSEWMSSLSRDLLSNCRNVLLISCTNIPHAFLNQNTSVTAQNIIFSSESKSKSANPSDHCLSLSKEIFSNVTFDPHYETQYIEMLNSLSQSHSAFVATNLVTQSYIAAMHLVVSNHRTLTNEESLSQENEEKLKTFTSPTTMGIVKDLLTSKSGIAVLLRVTSETLAIKLTADITEARRKLNMTETFEIMLYGSHMKPRLSDYFLQLVRNYNDKPDDWIPETLSDIDCIPLLLIYTGKDITSHIMPGTLKYIDFRLLSNNVESFTQSSILSEISLAHCVSKSDISSEDVKIDVAKLETAIEPPTKKTKSDSDDDALHMDTFSDESNENSENDENQLKWKSFTEKEDDKTSKQKEGVKKEFSSDEESGWKMESNNNNRKRGRVPNSSDAESDKEKSKILSSITVPQIIMTRTLHSYVESYFNGTEKFMDLPSHSSCKWSSHARPIISEKLTDIQTADYLRKWTKALPGHPDNSTGSEEPTTENSRNILLISPRQACVTLACCLFMKKMGRMLVKLMQVEVYDHKSSATVKASYPLHNVDADPHWPVYSTLLDMEFDGSIQNSATRNASRITNGLQELSANLEDGSGEIPTAPCIAGKLCTYDANHRSCDACKKFASQQNVAVYEISIPNMGVNSHSVRDSTIPLLVNFVIPENGRDKFIFHHREENISKVLALKLKFKNETCTKTPVFSLAISGPQTGLYNLDHTLFSHETDHVSPGPDKMEEEIKTQEPVHIIVIRNSEMEEFKKSWPNKILMVLPENFDDLGMGAMKYAVQSLVQHSVTVRQEQHNAFQESSNAGDVWPFALLLDDNAVVWSTCNSDLSAMSYDELDENRAWKNISLANVLERIESVPSATRYAAIGVRPWSTVMNAPKWEEDFSGDNVSSAFSKCQLFSCVAVNAVLTKDEMFDCSRFLNDEVDWCMRVAAADLTIFRFNDIAVAMKVMKSSSRNELTLVDCENPQSLVSLADSDFTPLPRHPNLLLEAYLGQLGHTVFLKSKGNDRHPVLVLDRYISLGPEVYVEFVSSKPDPLLWSTNMDKSYCGLLLYCQSADISPNFIEQFKFSTGATVCVVGRDRSSLRQTVVNLNLENNWHFRLTDEYQTTNEMGKRKPLFYLTGVARSLR